MAWLGADSGLPHRQGGLSDRSSLVAHWSLVQMTPCGDLAPVTHIETKASHAKKAGFARVVVPTANREEVDVDVELVPYGKATQVIKELLPGAPLQPRSKSVV